MEETGYFRAHWTTKFRKNRNRVISDNRKCSGNGQKLESWTDWMSSSEPKGVQVKILSHFGLLEQVKKHRKFLIIIFTSWVVYMLLEANLNQSKIYAKITIFVMIKKLFLSNAEIGRPILLK